LGAGIDPDMAFTPFPSSILDETRFRGKVGNIEYGNIYFEKAKFEILTSTRI